MATGGSAYAALTKSGEGAAPGDEEGIDESEGDVDLDQDVYGAAMFSLIFDSYEIMYGSDHDGLSTKMNMARMAFITLILMSNYLLQGSMLYFIFAYVVLPTVHETQRVYQKYHAEVFVDGVYDQAKWEAFAEQDSLCGIAFSNFFFMYAILCLWWCTMLQDVRLIERLWRNVSNVEATKDVGEMVKFPDEGTEDPIRVKKMLTSIRMMLYFGILIPKIIISVTLMFIGTIWLSATDNFGDLILNAVALEFVIAIDELLFNAMLPSTVSGKIEETKLWVKPKKQTNETKAANVRAQYARSLAYFLTVTIGVYLFMTVGQYLPRVGVFPGYAHDADCPSYLKEKTSFVCPFNAMEEDCFPFK